MDVVPSPIFYPAIVLCLIFILEWRKRAARNGLPLPPGPKGLPLVGNVFDLDIARPWLSYEGWGKQYGALVYSNLLGQDFVVLNTEKLAHELLDQRSTIYSDRPYLSTNKLFGLDFNSGLLPYGNKWRLHRKMFHVALSKEVVPKYRPMQMEKVHQLLENLLKNPREYDQHFKTVSAAIIMAITYGYDVSPSRDPFVSRIEELLELFLDALTPERATLLGAIPFLQHIPSWLPGGRYKRRASECRALAAGVLDDPVAYVKNHMAAGGERKCLVQDLYKKELGESTEPDQEEEIKAVAATVFLGGAETTYSTLLAFLLAMVLNPDAQTKAQEEIERVVGTERLPSFSDRPSLPYVEAVLLETMRCYPSVPIALPHMTSKSDVYDGMYIPKGKSLSFRAIVLINIWAITHDKTNFPDPMAFNPERFLTSSGALGEGKQSHASFGFDQSVWASIVSILATLRVGKARDEFGKEIEIKPEFTTGLSVHPKPFLCSIVPRSPKAERLIIASNVNED
ncbi:cytochrome P450 [Phlebopus sp. FC_14]|nr:cytochrome P450 [Phlebopus sp. FC_14]